jgi:hypothetical protein
MKAAMEAKGLLEAAGKFVPIPADEKRKLF